MGIILEKKKKTKQTNCMAKMLPQRVLHLKWLLYMEPLKSLSNIHDAYSLRN